MPEIWPPVSIPFKLCKHSLGCAVPALCNELPKDLSGFENFLLWHKCQNVHCGRVNFWTISTSSLILSLICHSLVFPHLPNFTKDWIFKLSCRGVALTWFHDHHHQWFPPQHQLTLAECLDFPSTESYQRTWILWTWIYVLQYLHYITFSAEKLNLAQLLKRKVFLWNLFSHSWLSFLSINLWSLWLFCMFQGWADFWMPIFTLPCYCCCCKSF